MTSNQTAKPGYMLSDGFSANTRTTLQHYLWKDGLNYLLHPNIPTTSPNLKVAEIGVGTGIWLIELARTLPSTAQLDGLDISFKQTPPKEWIPENISWITYNAFDDPPLELIEKYDVVHVQLFITLIRDGNPVPVLKNLMKILSKEYLFIGNIQSSALLKKWDMRDELEKQQYQDVLTMECTIEPGGYISWGEWDVATWEIIRTSSALSQDNEELNELKEYTSTLGKTRPGPSFISSGWISRLHTTFAENGLTNIIVDKHKFSPEIVTLLLDTWMVASQEISANVLDNLGGGQGDVARALVEKVGKNRGNTAFNLERVITVGRKPE